MLGLGFPALGAVVSGMITQNTPVSFGAVGTPMRVSVGNGLGAGNDPMVNDFAVSIGIPVIDAAAKNGFLMPKDTWDFMDKKDWESTWDGTIKVEYIEKPGGMSTLMAWSPYLLVAGFILFTRLTPAVKAWLNTIVIRFPEVGGIKTAFGIAYSPGTIFIVVSLLTFLIHGMKTDAYAKAWKTSGKAIIAASTALIFTVPMVQVFINSANGSAGYLRMPYALAEATFQLTGGMWPLFAGVIGGLGAFVAGSNTVSNMTFALLAPMALQWPVWIVALQAVGGAAGNVICIHNVVAASAVAGFIGREGEVIRKTLLVFLYYVLIPGAFGYSYLYWASKGAFNLGSSSLLRSRSICPSY